MLRVVLLPLCLCAFIAACGQEESKPATMEEALAAYPEETQLPAFLGLAFSQIRSRQLDARPDDHWWDWNAYAEPRPLLLETESLEILQLLEDAQDRQMWASYPIEPWLQTAEEGAKWYGYPGLTELAHLAMHSPVTRGAHGTVLVEAAIALRSHGEFVDSLFGAILAASLDPEAIRRVVRRDGCYGNEDLLALFARSLAAAEEPNLESESLFDSLSDQADCVECMRELLVEENRKVEAADSEEFPRLTIAPKFFDELTRAHGGWSCFQVCEEHALAPEALAAEPGEPLGYGLLRDESLAQWGDGASDDRLYFSGAPIQLAPGGVWIPIQGVDVVALPESNGEFILRLELSADVQDAFREWTTERSGRRIALVIGGYPAATPTLHSGQVNLAIGTASSPLDVLELRWWMRRIGRASRPGYDGPVLGVAGSETLEQLTSTFPRSTARRSFALAKRRCCSARGTSPARL